MRPCGSINSVSKPLRHELGKDPARNRNVPAGDSKMCSEQSECPSDCHGRKWHKAHIRLCFWRYIRRVGEIPDPGASIPTSIERWTEGHVSMSSICCLPDRRAQQDSRPFCCQPAPTADCLGHLSSESPAQRPSPITRAAPPAAPTSLKSNEVFASVACLFNSPK